jgi:hypothetical protein
LGYIPRRLRRNLIGKSLVVQKLAKYPVACGGAALLKLLLAATTFYRGQLGEGWPEYLSSWAIPLDLAKYEEKARDGWLAARLAQPPDIRWSKRGLLPLV